MWIVRKTGMTIGKHASSTYNKVMGQWSMQANW
jgi:hypothetical protein